MVKRKPASIISLVFVSLISLSPSLKRWLWMKWYNFIASHDDDMLLASMNYGYVDDHSESAENEPVKTQLALYDHVLNTNSLENKIVVEIGSGRGEGAAFIARKYHPERYIGVDLASNASLNSMQTDENGALYFITGDALSIPIKSNSVDIVINVESSHCYSDLEKFISQVSGLLVENGYFCYCDLMPLRQVDVLSQYFKANDMAVEQARDITSNVMLSLDQCSVEHAQKIAANVPWYLRSAFSDFAGIRDTGVYNLFKSGKYVYYSFLVKKKTT